MDAPCNVLVVDHDRLVNWVVTEWVEAAGCQAITAENAVQALEVLKSAVSIQVMVTDFCMPVFDGSELIGAALKLRPELDIIITTGHVLPPYLQSRYHVLQKPFLPTELEGELGRRCCPIVKCSRINPIAYDN
jgi:DNA-binding NtrC family response regulator